MPPPACADGGRRRPSGQSQTPHRRQGLPAGPTLWIGEDTLDLGVCPQVQSASVAVQVSPAETVWRASTAAPWLRLASSEAGGGTGDGLLTIAGDCTGLYRDDVLVGAPGARLHLVSVQMEVRDQPPAQAASLFLPLVTR